MTKHWNKNISFRPKWNLMHASPSKSKKDIIVYRKIKSILSNPQKQFIRLSLSKSCRLGKFFLKEVFYKNALSWSPFLVTLRARLKINYIMSLGAALSHITVEMNKLKRTVIMIILGNSATFSIKTVFKKYFLIDYFHAIVSNKMEI